MIKGDGPFSFLHSTSIPILGICGATRGKRLEIMAYLFRSLHDRGLHATSIHRLFVRGAAGPPDAWRYRIQTGADTPILPCDLVLTEDEGMQPTVRIRLDGKEQPQDEGLLGSFRADTDRPEILNCVLDWLARIWQRTPVWACVLIGGRSSRMGRAKHLIQDSQGVSWLARTVGLLRPLVNGVVISGAGEVPRGMEGMIRLADIPGASGPLAGVLSAFRWQSAVSWLVVACDMPDITEDALRWILSRRAPGVWGTVPSLQGDGLIEPLLSHYDFRCAPLFERILCSGCLRIALVAANPQIETPLVPEVIRKSWRNVNTIEELQEK